MSSTALHPQWSESLDPVLLRRLARPLEQAGVISLDIAKRIVAWVDYFSERLSLLQELSKKRGDQGSLRATDIPFVHARWVAREVITERTTLVREKATESTSPSVVSTVIERVTAAPNPRANTSARTEGETRREMPIVETISEPTGSAIANAASILVDALALPSTSVAMPDIPLAIAKPLAAIENVSPPVAKPLVTVENVSPPVAKPLVTVENVSMPVAKPLVMVENVSLPVAKPLVVVENAPMPVAKISMPAAKLPIVVMPTFFKVIGASTNAPSVITAANDPPVVRPIARNMVDSEASPELPHLRSGPMAATPDPSQVGSGSATSMVRTVPAAVIEPQPALQASPPPPPAPEVDVDVLVDRIEKKLLRRIAAERDRRGGFE